MTFELFRFANLVVTMSFVTDSDYDSQIGTIKVNDEGKTYIYWQDFHGVAERNTAIAEGLRAAAKEMEN